MQPDGTFLTINGNMTLWAHPSSVMLNRKADWVVFQEVVETGKKVYIKDVSLLRGDVLDGTDGSRLRRLRRIGCLSLEGRFIMR